MHRDPAPTIPECPVCDSTEQVQRHDKPQQGPWLCLRCMLLFSGTSAEYLPPPERVTLTTEIEDARAALKEGRTGG